MSAFDSVVEDYYDGDGLDDVKMLPASDMYQFYGNLPSVSDVWDHCMYPSIVQAWDFLFVIFAWNIAFRCLSQTVIIPRRYQHLASIVCGFILLWRILGISSLYGLAFIGMTYLLFYTATSLNMKFYGITVSAFSLILLCIGEQLDSDVETWHKMRGAQMVAAMKIISLAFDIERKKLSYVPGPIEVWGYIMCPGNIIMGPWCSYSDYLLIFHKPKWPFRWHVNLLTNFCLSLIFLLASNCLVIEFIPNLNLRWIETYKGALSYRCSHYFICYASHCTMLMSGFHPPKSNRKDKTLLGYSITWPRVIEFPRSLVNVVVYWNLSMHYWLKTYVFQQMKSHGKFWAILTTYTVSSMLHGVNIRLAAVLLSLGFATHAEFTIRLRLAEIFNACVTAHPCQSDTCRHKYKANNFYVRLVNLAFSILAIIHLAYLGIMFYDSMDSTPDMAQFQYVLMKWGQLYYLTHLLIIVTYIFIYCV